MISVASKIWKPSSMEACVIVIFHNLFDAFTVMAIILSVVIYTFSYSSLQLLLFAHFFLSCTMNVIICIPICIRTTATTTISDRRSTWISFKRKYATKVCCNLSECFECHDGGILLRPACNFLAMYDEPRRFWINSSNVWEGCDPASFTMCSSIFFLCIELHLRSFFLGKVMRVPTGR